MKKEVLKYQRNTAIQRVMEKYSSILASASAHQQSFEEFKANNKRTGELLALLAKPLKEIYAKRKEKEKKLREAMALICGMGLGVANSMKDDAGETMFNLYKREASQANQWDLYQTGLLVAQELYKRSKALNGSGLTLKDVDDFNELASDFGKQLELTNAELQKRKSVRKELKSVFAANLKIMKVSFDGFVNLFTEKQPSFYREYRIARKSLIPRKNRMTKKEKEITGIGGTVFNSLTGNPVAKAVLEIVDIKYLVTTDAKGRYTITNLSLIKYILTCHAADFKVPTAKAVKVERGRITEVNFPLVPEETQPEE